ncbi:MAG: GxxExxY protein [Verrucomicrobiota bacterium]
MSLEFPVERDPLTEKVIGCAIEVHRHLGPGLLEITDESALCHEFKISGLDFRRQAAFPVLYKGTPVGEYRVDLLIAECLIVELKSVERIEPLFEAQLLAYLKISGCKRGLLLNFNSRLLKDGIKRFIL